MTGLRSSRYGKPTMPTRCWRSSLRGPKIAERSASIPCERGGKLYNGTQSRSRLDASRTKSAFLQHAPAHLHLPLLLGLWTGQRQGDLLRLTWSAYDGENIRLRQSKTGVRVQVPVGVPLKAALDEAAKNKRSPIILLNSDGRPWTPDGFRASWGKAADKAGIVR